MKEIIQKDWHDFPADNQRISVDQVRRKLNMIDEGTVLIHDFNRKYTKAGGTVRLSITGKDNFLGTDFPTDGETQSIELTPENLMKMNWNDFHVVWWDLLDPFKGI